MYTPAAHIHIGELPSLVGNTKVAAVTKMSVFALERSGMPSVLQHGPPAGWGIGFWGELEDSDE